MRNLTSISTTLSRVRIREGADSPQTAKEVALQCPHCQKMCYVKLPYKPTALQRQIFIRDAIDEHRKICLAAPSDAGRVTKILYPR